MWWKVLGWASLIFFGGRALLGVVQTDRGAPPAAAPEAPRANIEVRVDGAKARHLMAGVTRVDWGDRWPFTVDEATLICVPDFEILGVYYVVGDQAFAATGGAQILARSRKLDVVVDGTPLRPALMDDANGGDLWAKAPAGYRVSIGPVIDAAMKLGCGG